MSFINRLSGSPPCVTFAYRQINLWQYWPTCLLCDHITSTCLYTFQYAVNYYQWRYKLRWWRQQCYMLVYSAYEGWSKSSRPDPSSDQNKIKIVFATYSSKSQNTTCAIWLLGYKYFVNFCVWTKCMSDGCPDPNTRTVHKFLKNFSNDKDVTQQKFISQFVIQDETWMHNFDSESEQQSMQWNERIGQNCHFITLRNSAFFHFDCR